MSEQRPGTPAVQPEAAEHRLTVRRQARYSSLGNPSAGIRELWIACHGYGQLARRFIRSLSPLDDGHRLVIAPEALNRFYLPDAGGSMFHQNAKVGATWMTREDRLAEIEDYVAYLDAVHREAAALLPARVPLHVLGFSQGVATVTRWLVHGAARADHLVLWSGTLPDEVDLAAAHAAGRWSRLTVVMGERDEFATAAVVASQEARLREARVPFDVVRHEGGHVIEAGALQRVAQG